MSSLALKRILFTIGGAAGLLAVVVLIAPLIVDINRFKPRLEGAASDALGMNVRAGGRLRLGFIPGLHVTIEDGRILGDQGVSVLSAKKVTLWIKVLPLLRREFRLNRIELGQPKLSIERDSEGRLNLERSKQAAALLSVLEGASVVLSNGTLLYSDKRSGGGFEAIDCDLEVRRIRLAGGRGSQPLKGLSLEAELACGEIRAKEFSVSALKASVDGKDGVIEFKPITMRIFGGEAAGSLRANVSGPIPLYQLRCSLPSFRIGEFLSVLSPKKAAEGTMDFSASLSMQGGTTSQLVQTTAGEISLRGGHLTLVGNDLDLMLSRFKSSQSFNLVDVAGVFLAGPLGLAATKGYSFGSLFRGTGGNCSIDTLVSDWKVQRGVARAKDVALATTKNRIALQGGLDFVNERFAGVTVAAIDAGGCASVRQAIRGSFENPTVEKPRVLKSLAGPALKLYRQTRSIFPSAPCEVFYSGSVPPPR